jgi:hypothetical protein
MAAEGLGRGPRAAAGYDLACRRRQQAGRDAVDPASAAGVALSRGSASIWSVRIGLAASRHPGAATALWRAPDELFSMAWVRGGSMRVTWIGALAAAMSLSLAGCNGSPTQTRHDRDKSVARVWNEVLIASIRKDFSRPTVHARNLWHTSAAMYDAWAAYDDTASTWLLGKTHAGYACDYAPPTRPRDVQRAREEAISFAAYRIIRHRFRNSPAAAFVAELADRTMAELGYDIQNTDASYESGQPAALGNHIAECYIGYGMQDGSNEANNYAPLVYEPVNPPIKVEEPGNPDVVDLDRWQQITLTLSVDQSGHIVDGTQQFVGPEWGGVDPFSLTDADKTSCQRAGFNLPVYHDPGPPPTHDGPLREEYKWTHSLVAVWSGHLDPTKGRGATLVDISPNKIGNIQSYPPTLEGQRHFYDLLLGGSPDTGYKVNPVTGAPYEPQLVPLGDYTRAIAEFWADGLDSETPPGHWFVIANTISDHPLLVKRLRGTGPVLGSLEWDVKIYFALGGAMHDAAIAAWGIKGCYDSIRPVSAIRSMADRGQASDPNDPDCPYNVDGIEYIDDPHDPAQDGSFRVIDCVRPGDPLADDPDSPGVDARNVGKIKLWAWRGPAHISNANFDAAGVGWILAENWWPYQRPTFVTPPFAGYISGHSTYSRTAAELLALFTGNPYFPGGKSVFRARKNEFLVFEDGPSVDLTLEWAKYVDASDQCSLSRLWGGIHPPADDIAGRLIGMKLGPEAFKHALEYFDGLH